MSVYQSGQLVGYKQFTDWSNNTWHAGNPTHRKHPKSVTACVNITQQQRIQLTL